MVQWGDVAEWVGGIATALALMGTTLLLFLQWRQLKLLREQEHDREADRDREQARLVSAWVRDGYSTKGGVNVRLRNGSEEPVWSCKVRVKSHWGGQPEYGWEEVQVLPPHEAADLFVNVDIHLLENVFDRRVTPPVEVFFLDAGGRFWQRTDQGRLGLVANPGEEIPPIGLVEYDFSSRGEMVESRRRLRGAIWRWRFNRRMSRVYGNTKAS